MNWETFSPDTRPEVRGARDDQSNEPRVGKPLRADPVQAGKHRRAARERAGEQPAVAVPQVREHVADHGNHYERLCGDEELRFVSAEGAEAEQRADERELRKTHRAGGGREHGADAAELVEEGLDYAPQST